MISVLPGQSFEFKNPNTSSDVEMVVQEVTRLVRGVSPFVNSVEIINKTKYCTVDIVFQSQKLQIIFKNPKDEEFDLNELENPVSPVKITGR